ncbi:MAG TPA: efflux RND transporter permease subunit [Caulobacteraceae bacterium]|jgi:HAE1 family hydrophobic/amphiphilic exporter-1
MRDLRISSWAIHNPIPVVVLFIALTLAGIASYMMLPVKQFPDVSFPQVVVTVTQAGAAPEELENQVTQPVENAVAGIQDIDVIQSTVVQGVSTTIIAFEIGADEQKAADDVQAAIDRVRPELPREIDQPNVARISWTDQPIITYAAVAPTMSDTELSWYIDDTISRTLLGEKGVARVNRVGGSDLEINVTLRTDAMAAYGLTAPEVNNALAQFSLDAPGGRVEIGGREQTIRVLGAADTVAALRAMTIPTAGGRYVRLTEIADIGSGAGEQRSFARLDGRPVVGFQVAKTKPASDIAVEDTVDAALAELEAQNPNVKFEKIVSIVDDTRNNFHATQEVLFEGMLLAALVVFVFLRNWRATAITAAAMPLALIPTFAFMAMMGFSLNVITLLALTLVIGILVDDAIVEIENIEKRIERGQSPWRAAVEGADAIGLAVIATTCAIIVVFLPTAFMPGIAGMFFKEFGLTVAVAVLFSLVVARLVTPLMAAYLLKPAKKVKPHKGPPRWYMNLLGWALDHRWLSVAFGGLLFVGSIMLVPLLPTGFQPPENPNFMYVQMQAAPGSTRQDMERAVGEATRLFGEREEVEHVFAIVGGTDPSGFGQGGFTNATLTLRLDPHRKLSVSEFKEVMRPSLTTIPDVRTTFLGGWSGAEVQTLLTSNDGEALERAVTELNKQMRTVKTIASVRPTDPPVSPELVIRPKVEEAARLGVTAQTIASVARVASLGDADFNVPKFSEGERRLPIRVRLPDTARSNLDAIRSLEVPTASGGTTTLDSVADISFQAGSSQIERLDRRRQSGVEADLAAGAALGQATAEINNLPIMKNLPEGVQIAPFGDVEAMIDMMTGLVMALAAGIFLIYGVMVLLFRSFFKPITILSALPLSLGGAFLALLVGGMGLFLPSLIGFLMLMGLAAKNSILLVEYAIERERAGVSQRDALIEACSERARPIVMTTFAMAAGMLPTALGLGEGSEFRQPMAIAVIGGLITSTALSLVLVPVVYEFVDDIEHWMGPKLRRFITPRDPLDEAKIQPAE